MQIWRDFFLSKKWQILYKGSTDVEWRSCLSPCKQSLWTCQAHIKKSNQTRATEQGSHTVVKMHWIIKKENWNDYWISYIRIAKSLSSSFWCPGEERTCGYLRAESDTECIFWKLLSLMSVGLFPYTKTVVPNHSIWILRKAWDLNVNWS